MTKEEKNSIRQKNSQKILKNNLVGKVIFVQFSKLINSGKSMKNRFYFRYNNGKGDKNPTGYYFGNVQIPLIEMKEIGEDYIRV